MNVERVITVKGELENMIRALEIIHSKVKSAFENDTKTYGAQAIMMGGIPPLPLAPPSFATASSVAAAAAAAAAFNASGPPNTAARYAAAAAAAAAAAQQQQHSQSSQQQTQGAGQSTAQNTSQAGGSSSAAGPSNNSAGSGSGVNSGSYTNYYQPMYHTHPAGVHPQHVSQNSNMFHSGGPNGSGHMQSQGTGQLHSHQQTDLVISQGPEPETVYLYIPNVAVGAIIGTKGSYIKNIIKLSGASVKITPLTPEESKVAVERQVVIIGTPESQWKAQYYIYDKIRQERFASDENVKLRAELQVPSHIVGRIIGKSGKNVRELQRSTGATIKLPEDATANNAQNQNQEQQEQQQQSETTTNTGETTATATTSTVTTTDSEKIPNTENVKGETKTTKSEKSSEATSSSGETKNEESASLDATVATPNEGNGQENLENQASTVTPLQGNKKSGLRIFFVKTIYFS